MWIIVTLDINEPHNIPDKPYKCPPISEHTTIIAVSAYGDHTSANNPCPWQNWPSTPCVRFNPIKIEIMMSILSAKT